MRRIILAFVAVLIGWQAAPACAQARPVKPVRWVVPFAAGGIVVGSSSPAEFGAFIRREAATWGPLIGELGLKID